MKLTDHQFLNKVVELFKLVYTRDIVLLIDVDETILFAGAQAEDMLDFPIEDLIGKNFMNALPIPEENIHDVQLSIKKVLKLKETQEFLSINFNHSNKYVMLHCTERPFINPATGNVVAISVESKHLGVQHYLYNLLEFISAGKMKPNTLMNMYKDELLTIREHEIAFLLFYSKTAKKISFILSELYSKNITAKTISNIISGTLYPKFNVYGLEALIDKLYSLGYHHKIPPTFMVNMHLDLS